MNAQRFFQRKEDYQERTANCESPFKRFNVQCLHCQSYKLTIRAEFDGEAGEMNIFLICPSCRAVEKVSVN
jgi:hypothetical protein